MILRLSVFVCKYYINQGGASSHLDCREDPCRVPVNQHGIQLLDRCGISGDNNFEASICINIGVWAEVLMYPNFINIYLKIVLIFKPVL